jgi:uncharacterized membrane protein YeaQ/YmgE (transglycosylase-associated protein family)
MEILLWVFVVVLAGWISGNLLSAKSKEPTAVLQEYNDHRETLRK